MLSREHSGKVKNVLKANGFFSFDSGYKGPFIFYEKLGGGGGLGFWGRVTKKKSALN